MNYEGRGPPGLRRRRLASFGFLLFGVLAVTGGGIDNYVYRVVVFGSGLAPLIRFGLLAYASQLMAYDVLTTRAFTFDTTSPYALGSYATLGMIVAVAVFSDERV